MSAVADSRFPRVLAAALERGEVLHFPVAPFPLPAGDDLVFLLRQRLASFTHKTIGYDPATRRLAGFVRQGSDQPRRLAALLAGFAQVATGWLTQLLPVYKGGLKPDRVGFSTEEEATRRLRTTARNDLLHIDAFPRRPTRGDRILRVFANIHPDDPRVWLTSDPFAVLLRRYGPAAGLPGQVPTGWTTWLKNWLCRLVQPGAAGRSAYDSFMLRFHDYLKRNDAFQEHCAKTVWHFQPGCVWAAMTDACSYAVLRGRAALEQTFFVARSVLVVPEEAPAALLERMCGAGAVSAPQRQAA